MYRIVVSDSIHGILLVDIWTSRGIIPGRRMTVSDRTIPLPTIAQGDYSRFTSELTLSTYLIL